MAKSSFKCTKCDRAFSMAAHLARHNNTIHGAGGVRKKAKGGKVGRGSGRSAQLSVSIGSGDASRVLKEMASYRESLLMQRSHLDSQIAGIENAMGVMGGMSVMRAGTGRRGRPPGGGRSGSLKDMIVKTLRQRAKALSPQEIADAVIKAGYNTTSANLTKAVSNALPTIDSVKKVGRGLYQA